MSEYSKEHIEYRQRTRMLTQPPENDNILPPGIPKPPVLKYKRIFFKECAVAGVSFHLPYDDELWDELCEGTKIALVRDRNNEHDKNAVAVALADDFDGDPEDFDFDFILGYIPRAENMEMAAMMDAGYADKFEAEITTFNRHGSLNDRIRITIWLLSSQPMEVKPDMLRAESVSLIELVEMVDELDKSGFAYFQWGGFREYNPDDLHSVVKGEKVVIVHRDEDTDILYLMRVLAAGDECEDYIDDSDSIQYDDDRIPFILTNVMGPVRIKKSDWPFLTGVDLCRFSAADYLPMKLSAGFKEIFKIQLQKTLNPRNVAEE